MNLIVQGSKNFTLSDRMKGYIEKKIEKISYFKNHIKEIDFHLDKEKLNYKVDVTIITHKFGNYQLSVADLEMYAAIDKVLHKIDVKINREKTKIKEHTKVGHEEMIQFFDYHEDSKPEPTVVIAVKSKPTELQDAYLQMKEEKSDLHAFTAVADLAPVFMRKLSDDVVYLFKKESATAYAEYVLKIEGATVSLGEKIREVTLEKMNLFTAQKKILDQESPCDLFITASEGKIAFLSKESNGKWVMMLA